MLGKFKLWRNKKVLMLMYHRIAEETFDPWNLCVSPDNFEAHLQVLQQYFNVISVGTLENYVGNTIPEDAVCISFDDGYSDNYSVAKPLLEKYEIPAVFFISSYFIDKQVPFWWDELEWVIFGKDLNNEGKRIYNEWKWPAHPPDELTDSYISEWNQLKPLGYSDIRKRIDSLKESRALFQYAKKAFPMSSGEMIILSKSTLFTIGAHTDTHPALSSHITAVQENEIITNVRWIEDLTGKNVTVLSYPYGDFNIGTLKILPSTRLKLAFTTNGRSISLNEDPHQLGRFQVQNWSAEQFRERLRHWLKDY